MNVSPQGSGPAASPAKFAHWARRTEAVEHAAAFRGNTVNWTGIAAPGVARGPDTALCHGRQSYGIRPSTLDTAVQYLF